MVNIYKIIELLVDCFLNPIFNKLQIEKQWRLSKEKSSLDKYSKYFLSVFIIGILVYPIYSVIIFIVENVLTLLNNPFIINIAYPIYTTLVFWGISNMNYDLELNFRYKIFNKEWVEILMKKIPAVLLWLFWTLGPFEGYDLIADLVIILIFTYEIFYMIILDNRHIYKYEYVTFDFYDNRKLERISIHNVYQKKAWIIVKSVNPCKEYRFRIKDIRNVEYEAII